MGLLGLLIAAVIIVLFFIFSGFSNSATSVFTPKDSKKLEDKAQEVMDSTAEKAKLQQQQIKNMDLP